METPNTVVKRIGRLVAGLLAFAFGYVVLRPLLQGDPVDAARAKLAAVEAAAARDSTRPPTEAFAAAARESGDDYISSATTEVQRRNRAADMYWGYYYRQTRGYPGYCRNQNVDLASWTKAAISANRDTHAAAIQVYALAGTDTAALFARLPEILKATISKELEGLAKERDETPAALCQYLDSNAAELSIVGAFEKQVPLAFDALMHRSTRGR